MLYKSTKNFLLTAFALIVLIPCSIVVLGTFKTDAEIYSTPLALPKNWTLNNFRTLFDSGGLITPFKNSVIVSISSVFITLLLASMAAYAIARSVTISGKVLFFLFTLGLAIPGQVNIIPIYVLFVKLHLNNSLIGSSNIKVGDIQNNAVTANSNPVEIGVAASASASGQNLSIKYKLKAFAPEAGSDYYVSAFIVEKTVNTLQTVSGSGDVATDHERVIRASALTNAAGAPTAFSTAAVMTSPAANAEVEKTISWTYTAIPQAVKDKYATFGLPWWSWNPANTGVVIAVWRKVTDPVKPFYLVNTVYADVK